MLLNYRNSRVHYTKPPHFLITRNVIGAIRLEFKKLLDKKHTLTIIIAIAILFSSIVIVVCAHPEISPPPPDPGPEIRNPSL